MDPLSLGKIVWVDVLLSGDNAIVIALAASLLPAGQRFWAMLAGTLSAIALRIVLTGSTSYLLSLPYLRVAGGLALLGVAIKMLGSGDEDDCQPQAKNLAMAVAAIVIADLSMSIDNILAIAVIAQGDVVLLAAGLAISMCFVIGGAAIITTFIERFPFLVWMGAGLLGYIAGETIGGDPIVTHYFPDLVIPLCGMAGVIVIIVVLFWRDTLKLGVE